MMSHTNLKALLVLGFMRWHLTNNQVVKVI